MPKLILRCNYLKNASPSHLANYMNCISTSEGVEKIDNTCGLLPATVKQKELIVDILSKIEDADRMHEYYDYLQRPTRENVTEFITQALENNLDIIEIADKIGVSQNVVWKSIQGAINSLKKFLNRGVSKLDFV